MAKTNRLRDAIRFALAAATTAAAGVSPSFAQEQSADPATLGRIEVTGSRIKRTDIETSQPIFSLSREDIQAQGLNSVADVLQNLTASGSPLTRAANNSSTGEMHIDLRNLGAARTLVLVNGRRWVGGTASLGGAVDLSTIPTAAVARIEVLKDGASVIYGSDAIAGVVNIILRDDLEGAEANAYIGQYDRGDGMREAYDFTIGTVRDGFSAMLGIGYINEEPVFFSDREVTQTPIAGTGTAFNSTTTPDGNFGLGDPALGSGARRRPDGTLGTFTVTGGNTADGWRPFNRATDSFNTAPLNYLLTPQERTSLFASSKLDITDNIRFKLTTQYNERSSEQLIGASTLVLGTAPGASEIASTISISEDSLFNPFGEDVTSVQRRTVEAGPRIFSQNVDTFVANLGLEGDFEIGQRYFSWEAGYFYGDNEQTTTTVGLFDLEAVRQGLGPSMLDPATGSPICVGTAGDASTVISGCVPINFLGGAGTLTQEMIDFATYTAIDTLRYEQKTYYGDISGELFTLPGGPLAFALGLEHREEFGSDQPDPLTVSGNTNGDPRLPTSGGFDVDEAFLELSIPLLADMPAVQLLDFSLATRTSDYSTFGATTNSKFGLRWKPIEDLLVRGNWSEGFRAPSVDELFTGVSENLLMFGDPCSTTFPGRYDGLTPEQKDRCHAQGVPVGGYDQGNGQIRITEGGNPDLQPETSTTLTLGFVYSPSWIEGLDITLDWWNVEIENTITTFDGQAIVDLCIIDGIDSFCQLVSRNQVDGTIDTLFATNTNIGSTEVEGYDLAVNYRLPEHDWGRLSFAWDTAYLAKYEQDLDGDGVRGEEIDDAGGNQVGEYQDGLLTGANRWRIRSNLIVRWELGDFGATLASRYYSHQDEECEFVINDYGFGELCSDAILDAAGRVQPGSRNRIGSATYHDISAYWNTPWKARVTLGINNALDRDPPLAFTAFSKSFDSQYEIPGRFYYMQYSQKF